MKQEKPVHDVIGVDWGMLVFDCEVHENPVFTSPEHWLGATSSFSKAHFMFKEYTAVRQYFDVECYFTWIELGQGTLTELFHSPSFMFTFEKYILPTFERD